jgi:RNA polymerase sigma-70 factor (ECF subfamily)
MGGRLARPTSPGGRLRMAVEQLVQDGPRYEEFIQLFVRHEVGLRAFVRSLVPAWADVDEVIQETCLVLWRKFDGYEPGSHFLRWACAIARFEVLKYRRKLSRERHVFNDELLMLLAEEAIEETDRRELERQALSDCLQKLTPRQQELIRGCYGGEQTIKEAAEGLGRTATSMYKAVNRIRLALLECVQKALAEEGRI